MIWCIVQKPKLISSSHFYWHLSHDHDPLSPTRIWGLGEFLLSLSLSLSGPQCASTYEPKHDKTNKMSVRPPKAQISLGIRPVWSESSLCAQWVAKDPMFLHAASENSDQTRRMPRLIWVFAGRRLILLVLSCRGSHVKRFEHLVT